ncbi:transcriptional regulator FeaR [Frateuria aurantia]
MDIDGRVQTHSTSVPPGSRPAQGFEEWQRQLRRICGSFAIRPASAAPAFSGYAGRLDFGGLEVARIRSNVAALARGRRQARNEQDYCYLILQLAGHQHIVAENQATIELRPGEMAVLDSAQPFEMILHGGVDNLSVHLPRRLLATRLKRPSMTLKLETARASSLMLGAMLARLGQLDPSYRASSEEGRGFRAALLELLPSTLASPDPCLPTSSGHDLYLQACSLIETRLHEPALDAMWLAQILGISRRQLYRLFAERGEPGVTRFIQDRRLDRAAGLLREGRLGAGSISALAQQVGLDDAAHFSRVFRRRFAMSPSHYRNQ